MPKGTATDVPELVRRVPAGEIEAQVVDQIRALLRQPQVIVGTWRAACSDDTSLTEDETKQALEELDPLWAQLFPAEQARIIQLLVERIEVGPGGASIRLRVEGLTRLANDLRGIGARSAAA